MAYLLLHFPCPFSVNANRQSIQPWKAWHLKDDIAQWTALQDPKKWT